MTLSGRFSPRASFPFLIALALSVLSFAPSMAAAQEAPVDADSTSAIQMSGQAEGQSSNRGARSATAAGSVEAVEAELAAFSSEASAVANQTASAPAAQEEPGASAETDSAASMASDTAPTPAAPTASPAAATVQPVPASSYLRYRTPQGAAVVAEGAEAEDVIQDRRGSGGRPRRERRRSVSYFRLEGSVGGAWAAFAAAEPGDPYPGGRSMSGRWLKDDDHHFLDDDDDGGHGDSVDGGGLVLTAAMKARVGGAERPWFVGLDFTYARITDIDHDPTPYMLKGIRSYALHGVAQFYFARRAYFTFGIGEVKLHQKSRLYGSEDARGVSFLNDFGVDLISTRILRLGVQARITAGFIPDGAFLDGAYATIGGNVVLSLF